MIQEQKKSAYVNEMFSKIAGKYDLLNNLMTFSNHNKWKNSLIKLALQENPNPELALDICTGTADLAIILNKYSPHTKIQCIDNCNEMLKIAQNKIDSKKYKNIIFNLMDSERLTFDEASFDLVTVGFGIRNLVNKEKCIKDVFNLLKKNGVFACIDLGHPVNHLWQKLYYCYFFKVVPGLGTMFARNKEAYTYLPNSLQTWYKQEEFKELILKSGFNKCYFKNIFGGIIAIHIAVKL